MMAGLSKERVKKMCKHPMAVLNPETGMYRCLLCNAEDLVTGSFLEVIKKDV